MTGRIVWVWPIIIVVVVGIIAAVFFTASIEAKKQAELRNSATVLVTEVGSFHSEVMELNPSAESKALLQVELQRLKQKAEHTANNLRQLQRQTDQTKSRDTAVLQEAIEAAVVYVNGSAKIANQAVSLATLKTAAEDFFRAYEVVKSRTETVGSPSRSEANDAIERMAKLVGNYSKKSIPTQAVVTKTPVAYYPTWAVSSRDREFFSGIAKIAEEIQESRRYLGSKSGIDWNQGKAGNWSYFNQSWIRSILGRVIEDKRDQLRRVRELASYEGGGELAGIVEEMLVNAIVGLDALRSESDYGRFKSLNNRNDQLAQKLSTKYGIKAFGR